MKHSQARGGRWQGKVEVTKLKRVLCGGIDSSAGKLLRKQIGCRHQDFTPITCGHWRRTINESVPAALGLFCRPTDQDLLGRTLRTIPHTRHSFQSTHQTALRSCTEFGINNESIEISESVLRCLYWWCPGYLLSLCFKAILHPCISEYWLLRQITV